MKKTGEKKIMVEADILSLIAIVLAVKYVVKYIKQHIKK